MIFWKGEEPHEAIEIEIDNDQTHRAMLSISRLVLWPRVVGKAITTGSQSFPAPPSEVSSKERVSTSGFEMSKILWSIAWLLLSIFVAYPLANFLGWWWVIIMPFESIIEARKFV
jgi:hypothetical protein